MTKADSSVSISSLSLSPCNLNPQELPPALKVPETKTYRLRKSARKGLLCAESSFLLFSCHPVLATLETGDWVSWTYTTTAKTIRGVLD